MPGPFTFPVDLTSIMLFASALGETNRIYYDENHAKQTPLGSVVAPPTFPIAAALWDPDYPLRGVRQVPPSAARPQRAQESGRAAASAGGGGLSPGAVRELRLRRDLAMDQSNSRPSGWTGQRRAVALSACSNSSVKSGMIPMAIRLPCLPEYWTLGPAS